MEAPDTVDVLDRHNGFTALTSNGTLWRPATVARGGTLGRLVRESINPRTFYQTNDNVMSADYRLPRYSYRVRVWWDNATGERIA